MTSIHNGHIVSNIDATDTSNDLIAHGYSIRAVETWHDHNETVIIWDAPESIETTDLPY